MRILHVAAITAGRPTGPAASVPLQMTAERGAGHDVLFLQSHPGRPPALPGGVTRLAGTGRWRDLRDLRAQLARVRPDVVHLHSVYLPRHAVIAAVARALGLPTVNSPRGGLMPAALAQRRVKKRLGDALFFDTFSRRLTLHRALCEAERLACLRRYPEVPARVAPNPIDVRAIPRLAPPCPSNRPLELGYLGRLDVEHKGLDLLLGGVARAVAGTPALGVCLRLCGPDHREGAARLARLVGELGLHARVSIEGPVEDDDRYRFLEAVDVFVHPSRFEGMPMGVLEAMAASRPVLVTPETNLADVVERHRAGWVVAGDVAALARTFRALAGRGDEIAARGAAANRAVRAEFSLETVGAVLSAAYEDVVRRAHARAA